MGGAGGRIGRGGGWALALALLTCRASARADELSTEEAPAETLDAQPAPDFVDPSFGPKYVIERVEVRGNKRTRESLITEQLDAVGLRAGEAVNASDARVEAARFRLLATGHFLDARLSVTRGAQRGGVVLLVEVEERGSIVVNELYPSTSAATRFWGGADASDTNFLGRGINLGAGFVVSTTPVITGAERGLGLRLHTSIPARPEWGGLGFTATALFNDASDFQRARGADDDPTPADFIAARTRRAGGIVGVNRALTHAFRGSVDLRGEWIEATLPDLRFRTLRSGAITPIDFDIQEGASHLFSATATLEYDTRNDPVLPRSGARVLTSLEVSGSPLGSSYTFAKALVHASIYTKMPHGHALGLHLFGGAIAGDPAYFDEFFIGDLNLLLPRRALGIDFSTLPSRNFLGTAIASHRYDNYAGRILLEYAIPIWRRRGFVYGGDVFAAGGLLGIGSNGDFNTPGPFSWRALPIDLTADLGLRLDTYVGIFTISIANAISRSSF
ncbi:MAG TPA: BamA/TamA family outer membrane protein [Polyangia bacterium]|nr:BamA/TamA family outer membrane protein [Polyangia bacterium]